MANKKKKNDLLLAVLFSVVWVTRPISYEEMRNQHPSELQITQLTQLKNDDDSNIKTKTRAGKNSIFVEAFQIIRQYPRRPNFNNYPINNYDAVEKRFVNPLVMLQAHLTCNEENDNLPRKIVEKDRRVQFTKIYKRLFKENYAEVFNLNLYLEGNLAKNASAQEVKDAEQKLFEDYEKSSKEYLKKELFLNPCCVKLEKCTYLNFKDPVTIYYNHLTDFFAIVDSKKNRVLDFNIATETKYAEIFAFKSSGTLKVSDICVSPDQYLKPAESDSKKIQAYEKPESKEIQVYEEKYILSSEAAEDILVNMYGSRAINVFNGEFQIGDWQTAKKIAHAGCFGIKLEDYGFSQNQAEKIRLEGGLVSYVRKGNALPNLDLIRAFQNAVKDFCEDTDRSEKNEEGIYQSKPAIIFFNRETNQIAVFNKKKKTFITAYKLGENNADTYLTSGTAGSY